MSGIGGDARMGSGAGEGAGSSPHGNRRNRSFSESEEEEDDAVRAFTSIDANEPENKNPRRKPDRTSNSNAGCISTNNNSSSRSRFGLHTVKHSEESVCASSGEGGGDDGDIDQDRNEARSSDANNATGRTPPMGEDSTGLEEDGRVGMVAGNKRIRGTKASNLKQQDVNVEGHSGNHSNNPESGGFLTTIRTMLFGPRDPESDLNVEMLEELHMATGFTSKELRLTRSHFLALVEDPNRISREEFLAIPSVAINPLRERLLVCFGFDSVESLEFKEFVEILSIFNNPGAQRDQKLRMAFTLLDIDGDGHVRKNDLVRYLELITAAPEGVKVDLDAVAARVIEEGVSIPGSKVLMLADFIKIMGAADFDDKLTIPL